MCRHYVLFILAPAGVFGGPFLKISYNWHTIELKKKMGKNWLAIELKKKNYDKNWRIIELNEKKIGKNWLSIELKKKNDDENWIEIELTWKKPAQTTLL